MATSQPVRRIDSHVHFWQVARGDYPWMSPDDTTLYRDYGPDDLQPHIEKGQIDEVVLVQAAPTTAETDYLLPLAAETAFVAGVIGWVDLESGNVAAELTRLQRNQYFKGVRPMLQDIADPDWILGPRVAEGLRALAAADLVLEFLVRPLHLQQV